ncbi:MAG: hypothetical protein EA397_19700 [Deltaproteobacteria bacterium]|nr:MAG: hypothetical protein EA397_19700 [Deltaproteobacteria bacterium]
MDHRYTLINGTEIRTASARFELVGALAAPAMVCVQDGVAIAGSSSGGFSSFYFCSPELTCRGWNVHLPAPDVVMTSRGPAFTAVIDEQHLLVWRLDSGEVLRITDRLGPYAHLDGAFVLAK